jgi:hypothetical protein
MLPPQTPDRSTTRRDLSLLLARGLRSKTTVALSRAEARELAELLAAGGLGSNLALAREALLQALGDVPQEVMTRVSHRATGASDRENEAMIGGESMPRIEGYHFGQLVLDGVEQTRDLIVLPERVLTNWWRADGHRLVLADLEDVIDELPERLVVGTGAYGQLRPDPETLDRLRQRGVEVEALPTEEAVRRYSELDPSRTAAALHLTC